MPGAPSPTRRPGRVRRGDTFRAAGRGILMTQRVEAAADAPAEDARADQRRLVQLIVAAVLMGATGVMLVVTGVWALIFEGSTSRELTGALHGHSLASVGVLVLVIGLVLLGCVVGV